MNTKEFAYLLYNMFSVELCNKIKTIGNTIKIKLNNSKELTITLKGDNR